VGVARKRNTSYSNTNSLTKPIYVATQKASVDVTTLLLNNGESSIGHLGHMVSPTNLPEIKAQTSPKTIVKV